MLGGADGFAVLRRFSEEQPEAQVILMTGHGSAAGALDATAYGAYDYLMKPFTIDDVLSISGAVRKRMEKSPRTGAASEKQPSLAYISDIDLVGRSAAFVQVMKLVGRVSSTNLPVLITGESGTGKEVVARAIHRRSQRSNASFVAVNCGALPSELIESELFGHVRGSFTGAERDRMGLWEEASGGTVFLDEVTETSLGFQVKLLRALQEGEIRRVGSNRTINVDVRVIAATNRTVEEEVQQERFRQDLLYRLNAVRIHLPPLRERKEDIMLLARHMIARVRAASDLPLNFSSEAVEMLEEYRWPGNIRELENAMMRAVALCDHLVRPQDLPEDIRSQGGGSPIKDDAPANSGAPYASEAIADLVSLAEMEVRYVTRVLAHTGGNKQAAARLLGIDRSTLQRMIKRHDSGKDAPEPSTNIHATPLVPSSRL